MEAQIMTNKHDDRLNKLEQWLEKYGENEAVVRAVGTTLRNAFRVYAPGYVVPGDAIGAVRDLANIVGVGLEDLEGP
jgi:hypothetical protein